MPRRYRSTPAINSYRRRMGNRKWPKGPTFPPPAPPAGGGFFDEPWIDEALAGTVQEAFRDGFESGDFSKWPITEGSPTHNFKRIHVQTGVKRDGVYGAQLECFAMEGATWDSNNDSPKIAITRAASDTPANYPLGIGKAVYDQIAFLVPVGFPNVGTGTAMGNATNLMQIKAGGPSHDHISSVTLGKNAGDPTDAIRLRLSRDRGCNNPDPKPQGWASGNYSLQGANALVTRGDWYVLTRFILAGTKVSNPKGQLKIWLDGVKIFDSLTETGTDACFDTVTEKDCTTDGVPANGWEHYPSLMPSPGTATEPGPFSVYFDTYQMWGVF